MRGRALEQGVGFDEAAMGIREGKAYQRVNRKGGLIVVKSIKQAFRRMGIEDWLATDWEEVGEQCEAEH